MRIHTSLHAQIPRYLGCFALAVTLCSCNLLIPENPSAPRYNSVLGGPRAPALNPAGSGASGAGNAAPASPATGLTALTPASAAAPVAAMAKAPGDEIVAADVPPPAPLADQQARRVPVENQLGAQLAANYPDLGAIPPTPPLGDQGDAARLARIRAQLEADSRDAAAARNQLNRDAAAEPSLLNAPVPVVPPVPSPSMPPQSSVGNAPGYIAQLPPPPPSPQNIAGAGLEPIVLRAPGSSTPATQSARASVAAPAEGSALAPAMAGGFNPMAGSEPILLRAPTSYAGGTSYLPDSRYATRRN
jgi:hypothetical protein